MNLFSIISMVAGFGVVVTGILLSGKLIDFFDPASIFVVIGGCICAICISYSPDRLKKLFKAIKVAFKKENINYQADIEKIVEIANIARKNGLLALEEMSDQMDEPFLKKGILLVVDGSDPELIRSILETEISVTKSRHADNRAILDTGAAYAPAFGMIGTLIGLINMLTKLEDMSSLGANMSVALVTTFYGTMLANLIFNPLSKRLKSVGGAEYLRKELIIEGIMAIQNGENPRIIQEKLNAFLSNAQQQSSQKEDEDAAPRKKR